MHHANFVHLHLHTQYSLLDGAIKPDELLDLAREYKMPAVAMTDHGNLFGAVDFYQKAMSKGIKPIIGCEVYVAPRGRTDKSPNRADQYESTYHLILLVKNARGYQNLCKLISSGYTDGFYYKPRVDKEILKECSEGLIALSACLHGEVAYYLSFGQRERAEKAALEYKELFPERRFFLEIQKNGIDVQEKVNEDLIALSRKLDIPLVATNDCHYLRRKDAKNHDILLCIQTGKTVNDENRMRFTGDQFYFKSPDEMTEAFKDIPEAIESTVEIAERCNLEMNFGEYHLPDFPLPEGVTLDEHFEAVVKAGLEDRFDVMRKEGADVESEKWRYLDRINKEMKVIKGMGFPGYFLIVSDFIEYSRSNGIPVGPGRGSAAGSLVAYAMKITNIDPIKYSLLFERFLNPDRISLPDIDIDFCYEGRDKVIKYVSDKYGADKVTQIITFGQMKAKAVIRDVGRVMDMPYSDVDKISKLVPNELGMTLEKALGAEPKLARMVKDDPQVEELMTICKGLEGLPRHASTHAAGVVISNKPLVDYLPLYMGQKEGVLTTQFPMSDVEKIGLVKFDFLGLKTLTVIDKALKHIKANRGIDIDIDTVPVDDAETYKLISRANTDGVFQLESSGIKEMLRKLKPNQFEDLMAAVALYRPGPLQSGMVDEFIDRKHGRKKIDYPHKDLEEILDNTYGIMVYQEQVMEISKVLATFTPGDADMLRKAMGKKNEDVMLEQRTKFIEGAKGRKVAQKKAEEIFDLMAHFAGYGFNKSHSAAYALIAYHTAYLKAHYPVEFMASLLSNDMGDTDKVIKYISACKEMEIEVLPPDVNESGMDFTVVKSKIRFGLAAVKNVGGAAIESILAVRDEGGPFTSFMDFLTRIDSRKVNKKVLESLIKCGAFDSLGSTRNGLYTYLERGLEIAQGLQRDRENGQSSIFDMMGGSGGAATSEEVPERAEWDEGQLLSGEKETLGFYISSHPLMSFSNLLERRTKNITSSIKDVPQGKDVILGGVIASSRVMTTKKGSRMAFLRLEDLTGSIEVIVFPALFKKVEELLNHEGPLVIMGKVEREQGRGESEEVKVLGEEIYDLEEAPDVNIKKVHITADTDGLEKESFVALKNLLKSREGTSPVILHLMYPTGEVIMGLSDELKVEPVVELAEKIRTVLPSSEISFM